MPLVRRMHLFPNVLSFYDGCFRPLSPAKDRAAQNITTSSTLSISTHDPPPPPMLLMQLCVYILHAEHVLLAAHGRPPSPVLRCGSFAGWGKSVVECTKIKTCTCAYKHANAYDTMTYKYMSCFIPWHIIHGTSKYKVCFFRSLSFFFFSPFMK